MSETAIAFPNLGIYLENVPKTFVVFGFPIAVYGVMISLGILLGFTVSAWIYKRYGGNDEHVWDFAVPAVVCSVAGARLYYVAMSWDSYKDDPISVLYLRQGGLAIYGGVIAGFLTMYVFVRIKKLKYLPFADALSHGLLTGQIIGRWGNFFNREAFGDYTDNLFAMRLPISMVRSSDITEKIAAHITDGVNYIQVHPTFFYEGCWNAMSLAFLILYGKKRAFDGELFLMYIALYGFGRFFIESLRTDQLIIPGTQIPVSMAVSSVSALCAVGLILYVRIKKKDKKEE